MFSQHVLQCATWLLYIFKKTVVPYSVLCVLSNSSHSDLCPAGVWGSGTGSERPLLAGRVTSCLLSNVVTCPPQHPSTGSAESPASPGSSGSALYLVGYIAACGVALPFEKGDEILECSFFSGIYSCLRHLLEADPSEQVPGKKSIWGWSRTQGRCDQFHWVHQGRQERRGCPHQPDREEGEVSKSSQMFWQLCELGKSG